MRYAALAVVVSLLLAACGPSYVPPANTNTNAPSPKPKKSFKADYERESQASLDAQSRYKRDSENKEAFVDWMVHTYNALKYVYLHRKENGDNSTEGWANLSKITQARADFKSILGPPGARDDERVKKAIKESEEATR